MADDLRQRYADAIARWALMYPIPAWSLSEGERAEKLARNWGRHAAEAVLAVRDDELADALRRAERAEAVIAEHVARLIEQAKQAWYREQDRARLAEAATARVRERLDALIADGFGATTPTLRDLRDLLDVPADGEQTSTLTTEEGNPHG